MQTVPTLAINQLASGMQAKKAPARRYFMCLFLCIIEVYVASCVYTCRMIALGANRRFEIICQLPSKVFLETRGGQQGSTLAQDFLDRYDARRRGTIPKQSYCHTIMIDTVINGARAPCFKLMYNLHHAPILFGVGF
jgi:hypothetical protein